MFVYVFTEMCKATGICASDIVLALHLLGLFSGHDGR